MAQDDLLRSNIGDPSVPLETKTPAVEKTSAAFSQLAALGAAGIQTYQKEHEVSMTRQAMNDVVNKTVNPDLQHHEAAYAQIVAKGQALQGYNALNQEIQNGTHNDTAPEDFQKFITEKHTDYKSKISKSKYSKLEAAEYDKFWIQNEATLTAGQNGMYRKGLQVKQNKALLSHMQALVQVPDIKAQEIIDAVGGENYSLLKEEDVTGAALFAGIQTANSDILKELNSEFNFDVDPRLSKMYNAALASAQKGERASTIDRENEIRQGFVSARDKGMLTPEAVNTLTKKFDSNGKPFITPREGAQALGISNKNRIGQSRANAVRTKLTKGISIETYTPKEQETAATQLIEEAFKSGAPDIAVMQEAGKVATLMNVTIPYVKSLAGQVGQFDMEKIDEDSADEFFKQYDQLRTFFSSMGGKTNPMYGKYLGQFEDRYNKLEEYFKYSSGDNVSKLTSAAKIVNQWEQQKDSGIPMQDTADWDVEESGQDYLDERMGFWASTFGVDTNDRMLMDMHDSLTKKLGADLGMSQEDAAGRASRMLDESVSFLSGSWQPIGKEDLIGILGLDPEKAITDYFSNPAVNQSLDSVMPGREPGTTRNKEDYKFQVSAEGDWVTITDKANPEQSYNTSMAAFKSASGYTEKDANELINIDGLLNAAGDEGKEWRNLAIADADDWFYDRGLRQKEDYNYVAEILTPGVGVTGQVMIPNTIQWGAMSSDDKIKFHKSWLNVHFNGSMQWTDKINDIISVPLNVFGTIGSGLVEGFKQFEEATVPEGQRISEQPERIREAITTISEEVKEATKKAADFLIDKLGIHLGVSEAEASMITPDMLRRNISAPVPVVKPGKVYHGKSAISEVEKQEGKLSPEQKHVVKYEGYVAGEYKDSKGISTRGVGQTGKYKNMTFKESFDEHEKDLIKLIPSYRKHTPGVRKELIQAMYRGDISGSPTFRKLFNAGKYRDAAKEFLNNDEYKDPKTQTQIKKRMESVAKVVKRIKKKK